MKTLVESINLNESARLNVYHVSKRYYSYYVAAHNEKEIFKILARERGTKENEIEDIELVEQVYADGEPRLIGGGGGI